MCVSEGFKGRALKTRNVSMRCMKYLEGRRKEKSFRGAAPLFKLCTGLKGLNNLSSIYTFEINAQ